MNESNGASTAVQQMVEQTTRMLQTAWEAGIRFQEESTKALAGLMKNGGSTQQWQDRTKSVVDQTVSCAKQNMDLTIQVVNENTKTGLDLLTKMLDVRQPVGEAEAETRTKDAWETSVGSLRRNAELLVQVNRRLLESWQEVARIVYTPSNGTAPHA